MKDQQDRVSKTPASTPERKGKDRGKDALPGAWGEGAAEVERRRGDGRSDVELDEGIEQRPTDPNDPRISPS